MYVYFISISEWLMYIDYKNCNFFLNKAVFLNCSNTVSSLIESHGMVWLVGFNVPLDTL